ncbi:N-terminal kinase-like protein isoform X1 [Ciona intestinalis]
MWSFFSRDPAKGFPYEVGERVEGVGTEDSVWALHHGKQKSNGQPVSVFMFDVTSSNETVKQTAQASAKRLKTLRHPNVLTFIDSLETDKCIYVVTEPIKPLELHLREASENGNINELAISWGLHQIVKGVSFLLNSVNLIHNNVCMSSMFVDAAGEWKLGGVDYMYPASGEGSNYPPIKMLPALEKYDPPEKNMSSSRMKKSNKWSADMWGLGCLIWEVFNGKLPRTSSLKVIGKVPKSLVRHYCELVSANPASRPSPDKFLENCKQPNCFMANYFVQTNLFLVEIQIKDPHEQNAFFTDLTKHLDTFPSDYCKFKILPQLLNAFQFGNGGPSVLPPLFKLGKLLDNTEYQARIVPCVVKLFTSTDRATRILLLRQLPLFAEHLQPDVVNSQVFPNMVSGFMDTNPAIREQSVKAMLLLAPKLNDNNLNNELMKHFARLQSRDDQGPIRTNTTVCLGKIVPHLNPATRQKVVSSAFMRAMKDPFPAARIAGVLALCNNVQFFTTTDAAMKALPALCMLTVDQDKQVRDHVFKTIQVFIEKLQTASDDPEEAEKMNRTAGMINTSSTVSTGWAGWMTTGVRGVTSITSKLYTGTNKPDPKAQAPPAVPTPAPQNIPEEPPLSVVVESSIPAPQSSYQHPYMEAVAPDAGEDANGWEDEEWDNFETVPRKPTVSKSKRKIVMLSELRAMEEEIWHDLHTTSTEKSNHEEPPQPQADDFNSWDHNEWGDVEEEKEEEENVAPDDNGWGGGWEDAWSNAETMDKKKSPKFSSKVNKSTKKDEPTPASSYNWSQEPEKTAEDDNFFSEFLEKPKKTLTTKKPATPKQQKPQKPLPSTKAIKSIPAKPSVTKTSDWSADGWGEDGWETADVNEGLTKAERAKLEREEKRKLRQKQLEDKRAAKSSNKLGSRKCD